MKLCPSKTLLEKMGNFYTIQKHQHQRHPLFWPYCQCLRDRQTKTGSFLNIKLQEVEAWRARKGALHAPPKDFDPSRYGSFSVREVVE